MLYHFLKFLVSIGIRFYYKEIKIINKSNLPDNGPCIYIANHPNTLMDAWMIGYVSKMPIYFMAKGTLFSSSFKSKILRSLNMIPINRRGDEQAKGVSNAASFESCYQILKEGKCLLIFPEGTSFLERHLRELKSGTARIALEAEHRNANKLGIKIIPLGLNYIDADRFRSRVLIHIGKAISLENYYNEYEKNQSLAAKKLTELFRIRLEQVLVSSSEKEDELLVEDLYAIFSSKYIKNNSKGAEGDYQLLKQIRDKINELSITEPWKINEIKSILLELKSKLSQYEIRADFLDRRFRMRMFLRQIVVSLLFLLIGLPIFIFGIIHNIIQYKLTDLLVPRLTKDIEYYAPLSVLVGLILYPLTYCLFMVLSAKLFQLEVWEKIIYFSAMPLTGLLAYSIHAYFKHITIKWRFMTFLLYRRELVMDLKDKKEQLRQLIFEK